MKYTKLLNHTFFHFVMGFLAILLASFLLLFAVNAMMMASDTEADVPFSTCVTSSGEPC